MSRRHRGRHAQDPKAPPVSRLDIDTTMLKPPAADAETVTQWLVYGEIGQVDYEVAHRSVPISEAHLPEEIQDGISLVAFNAYGDGKRYVHVEGYDPERCALVWRQAAFELVGFHLQMTAAEPIPAADPGTSVICTHCGGQLHEDGRDWLHEDGEEECPDGRVSEPIRLIERTLTPADGAPIPPDLTEVIPAVEGD